MKRRSGSFRQSIGPGIDQRPRTLRTWFDACKAWEQHRHCEAAAIGILYDMATICIPPHDDPPPTDYDDTPAGLTAERIDFFLEAARQEHSTEIARVAAQQLVRRFLDAACVHCGIYNHRHLAHDKLLRFLQKPAESLRRPPYPRLVQAYLGRLATALEQKIVRDDWTDGNAWFLDLLAQYARAACPWGLAHTLTGESFAWDALPVIRNFCERSRLTPLTPVCATLRPLPDCIIEDLTAKGVQEEIGGRALAAYLHICAARPEYNAHLEPLSSA